MDFKSCTDFLRKRLPAADFADYPEALFAAFIDHALMLRESVPACAALDEELFCHYVLCPRVNDEDLSFHRRIFFDALWPRVEGLEGEEAVQEVNRWCHEEAGYQSQDDRTASPLTVWRNASGRCGEESAFLVSALRSVGIPARQVYASRWSHCDDNHAWAEALCGGTWRFLGACEPEPVLNRGWFNTAASRAVLIHSRTFGRAASPLHGAPIGETDGVVFYNQTARYASVKEVTLQITRNGTPAPHARITLHILNEAHFYPIAHLTADETGTACVSLGKGDVWVSAALDGLFREGLCPVTATAFALELTDAPSPAGWTEFDFHAPEAAPAPTPLMDAQKAARKAVLERGAALRRAKTESWYQGQDELLKAARGNVGEIAAFLSKDADPLRRRLVESLSPKDLRDVTAATLEQAFSIAAPYAGTCPDEIFDPYLLCPRVAFEGLTQQSKVPAVQAVLALRAQGAPARLRPLDGAVERWENGVFHTVKPEQTGVLRLTGEAPASAWSLARFEAEGWRLLHPEGRELVLPVGRYRLTTSVRLPSGDQFAAKVDFAIDAHATVAHTFVVRAFSLADLLYARPLPPIPAEGTPDALAALDAPTLLFWLEEGGEPTEHVLNELSAAAHLPPVVFFLRSPEALKQATLAQVLAQRPEIPVFFDDWAYDLESLSRLLGTDPEKPPLAVVWDGKGNAVYAESGYRVGSVALLSRIAQHLNG